MQDTYNNVLLRITLDGSYFVCYPSITTLGNSISAKVLADQSRWGHFACSVDGTVSSTLALFHNSSTVLTSTTTGGALSSLVKNFYRSYIAVGFKGAMKELRLWSGALSQTTIQSYLFQAIDTTEMLSSQTPLLLYFPFNTDSDVSNFQSGLTSSGATAASLTSVSDYASIKYSSGVPDLIICPVGQIYIDAECVTPSFALNVQDLVTDCRVTLVSSMPVNSPSFTYKWQYPTLSPSNSDVAAYFKTKIDSIVDNSFIIFKPKLKSEVTITFAVVITPVIYSTYPGTTQLTKTVTLSPSLGCPTPTLNITDIELSNADSTTVDIVLSLSSCVAVYKINSVTWSVANAVIGSLYLSVNSTDNFRASIPSVYFSSYALNTQYTISSAANVTFTSSSGEAVSTVVSAAATVSRHEYELSFESSGPSSVASYEDMTLSSRFNVVKDSSQITVDSASLTNTVICPGGFASSACGSLPTGFTLTPVQRATLGIKPGAYTFSVTGKWKTLSVTQGSVVTLVAPSPGIARKSAVSLFYDYVVYELAPDSAISTICSMVDMDYRWYNNTRAYPQNLLTNSYELKVSKAAISNTNKIIAEMMCNATSRVFYDFVAQGTSGANLLSSVGLDTSYMLTPLKDPLVVDLSAIADTSYLHQDV